VKNGEVCQNVFFLDVCWKKVLGFEKMKTLKFEKEILKQKNKEKKNRKKLKLRQIKRQEDRIKKILELFSL